MRILIVDDHPLVLQAIALTLESCDHQVSKAVDSEQAKQALTEYFDVLLLDYNMQTSKGTDLLTDEIIRPGKVLLISGMTDPDIILHTLDTEDIDAFVSKQLNPEELPLVVEQVTQISTGTTCIWMEASKTFVKSSEAYEKNQILSPKEREVFMLLRKGMLDKQIAEHINRSIHTIRVQIRSIKRKRGGQRRRVPEL